MAKQNIRGFLNHFTNLKPAQKAQFERIITELQGTLNATSLTSGLDQLRRTPNSLLPVPQLTVRSTVRGAAVEWIPLQDPYITFYEVEVSDSSNFAEFETVTTFGTEVVIDGVINTKFVRVRGIRNNGDTTPRSEIATISPILFDIRSHLFEGFYVLIPKEEFVNFAGEGSTVEYITTNPNGNSMVWGGVQVYGDPNTGISGSSRILLRLFADIVNEAGDVIERTEVWRTSVSEYFGYYSFGPCTIAHGPLNSTMRLRMEVSDFESGVDNTTKVEWLHINAFELGIIRQDA